MALAAGPGDRGAAGVGLEASGVGEAGAVVADLGRTRAPVSSARPGKLVMIAASGCWAKRSAVAAREVVGVGAGGVELAQQGQGLAPEGLLDQGRWCR